MIRRVQVSGYRCLQEIDQYLREFQVLVGPNASGKTTFLDVICFISEMASSDLIQATTRRTQNFQDLVWRKTGSNFRVALEASIPERLRLAIADRYWDTIRYEVEVGIDSEKNELAISSENVVFTTRQIETQLQQFFANNPENVKDENDARHKGVVIRRSWKDGDLFISETAESRNPVLLFRLAPAKSCLGILPPDESAFPVTTWFRRLITEGTHQIALNTQLLKKPSPPDQGIRMKPDGSNLPWLVGNLQQKDENSYSEWIMHLRTALPDIESIRIVERPEDRHRYMMLQYAGGIEVPSWTASDGTLRLLALTLLAYLPDLNGIYLIEEPENGIHPRALETVVQSLSSMYEAQVLLATHSPLILGMVDLKDVLCFTRDEEGATKIVQGDQHPLLKDWHGEIDLGTLFAGGVLE